MNEIANLTKIINAVTKKYRPEILTGIGITGMITSTILAVRATPKALILLEDEKRRINHEMLKNAKSDYARDYHMINPIKSLPVKDVIKITWRCYVPSVSFTILSTLCLVGASSANFRRNTALATAYSLSESAFKEYQSKVIEEIGNKKEQEVRDSIAKDKLNKNPIHDNEIFITEKGNTLCFDAMSGRYFKSDIDTIKKVENDLNRRMRDEIVVSLNDFYYEIGLKGVKMGDELGWNIDDGYIDIQFYSQLTEEDKPCIVIDYTVDSICEYI